jgi:hypothetical protein
MGKVISAPSAASRSKHRRQPDPAPPTPAPASGPSGEGSEWRSQSTYSSGGLPRICEELHAPESHVRINRHLSVELHRRHIQERRRSAANEPIRVSA